MQVKILQNAPREHSAILLIFIKLQLSYRPKFVLSICERPHKTGLTVCDFGISWWCSLASSLNNHRLETLSASILKIVNNVIFCNRGPHQIKFSDFFLSML